MSSSSLIMISLLKSAQVGARNAHHPMQLLAASARHVHSSPLQQAPACEKVKDGANQVKEKAKDVAGEVSEKAKDVAEKAKKAAGDTWVSTKGAAEKAKETVEKRTDVSKEYVKEHADQVKKSMNVKKE